VSVYFIGTAHDEYRERRFPEGSVVIDPWRMIPDQQGVTVRRLGENRPALISVLLPSRGRPHKMAEVIRTALATATHNRSLEFIVYLDDDDPKGPNYGAIRANTYGRWLRYVQGPRILLSECWNECYREADGEILMHAGDDITFNTPGWDVRVREEFAKLPDRIGLVFGDDLSTNFPDLATHGFLHRRWVETVGYFLPPLFSSDWNDVWISEVAKQVGRFVPMPDVVIEHHHHSFGKAEYDQTHREREQRGQEDDVVGLFKSTATDRAADAVKLLSVMS
jgi:hypothetical protein